MTESIQAKEALFATLPAPWKEDLASSIGSQLKTLSRNLVVLDDDPTGTQTVHGVPVLTEWTVPALAAELDRSPVFYILTNSRSLDTARAEALAREIGANLQAAAEKAQRSLAVASRSDSTLRGHFPAEVDALAEGLGGGFSGTIVVPFFEEGGRFTIDDVHYVQQGEKLVPAAQTEFAKDKSFGFSHSNLTRYVEEKSGGRIRAGEVVRITLDDLRQAGAGAVAAKLEAMPPGGTAIVNSACYRDQEVFVSGLLAAETAGKRFLYRCAASFVRVRGGIAPRPLLSAAEMRSESTSGGLVVVGSYVARSSEQLERAVTLPGVTPVELQVEKMIDAGQRGEEIERVARQVNETLESGADVVLFTSRDLKAGHSQAENLSIGSQVSEGLCTVVESLRHRPGYLIAKGGITSSDVATRALGVKRAMVLGQIQPGVPVWRLGDEAKFPGMAYVVFPGNVGDADSVAHCMSLFRED